MASFFAALGNTLAAISPFNQLVKLGVDLIGQKARNEIGGPQYHNPSPVAGVPAIPRISDPVPNSPNFQICPPRPPAPNGRANFNFNSFGNGPSNRNPNSPIGQLPQSINHIGKEQYPGAHGTDPNSYQGNPNASGGVSNFSRQNNWEQTEIKQPMNFTQPTQTTQTTQTPTQFDGPEPVRAMFHPRPSIAPRQPRRPHALQEPPPYEEFLPPERVQNSNVDAFGRPIPGFFPGQKRSW